MATADEVIVEFEAKVGKYEADLRRSAATFDRTTGAQQKQMIALERQISASSGRIGNAFKGLAALFGAQQVAGLSDSYTRLQNSLKVAGLEGENLADVQSRLLDLGGRYGVNINTLADLYGNLSQVSGELGASQAQVLQINEAVAQSLIVTGKSSTEASGAVLGLVQAFGNGKLQAEEWAQINEGGLRPLLEAAAASDKYGGSVQKLRKAVYDGKVTSQEFFQAILAGADVVGGKAANATLTLEGAYTSLNNRLIEYVGSAAASSGVATAAAKGMQLLADNLDTVATALAVIAIAMGVRYVGAAGKAAAASIALSAANTRAALTAEAMTGATYQSNAALLGHSAAARVATASVTGLSVAQGLAVRSGGALLALIGGPLGAAVLALGGGILYLNSRLSEASERAERLAKSAAKTAAEADRMEKRLRDAGIAVKGTGDAALKAAQDMDVFTKSMIDGIVRMQQLAQQAEVTRLAVLGAERAQLRQDLRSLDRDKNTRAAIATGGNVPLVDGRGVMRDTASEAAQRRDIMQQDADIVRQMQAIVTGMANNVNVLDEAVTTTATAVAEEKKDKKDKGPKPYERSAEAAERELARLRIEALQSQLALVDTIEERTQLQKDILREERAQRVADVQENKDLTAVQRQAALEAIDKLYGSGSGDAGGIVTSAGLYQRELALEEGREILRREQDIADERFRAEQDILRNQYDLADSSAERKRLALASIDLEERYQRAQLQAIIDLEGANSADGLRAQAALDGLEASSASRRRIAERSNQSPLEAYRDRLDRDEGEMSDLVESYVVDELDHVRDGIRGAIEDRLGIKDPLIGGLLNLLIEDLLIKPALDALRDAKSGGGGGLGSLVKGIGSLFGGGRAIGGPVKAGTPYMVGESGREMFVPQQSGVIVPNHRLSGNSTPTVINQSFTLDARGGITTPELLEYVNTTSRREAARAGGASFAQGQRSAPATLRKFNQLKD